MIHIHFGRQGETDVNIFFIKYTFLCYIKLTWNFKIGMYHITNKFYLITEKKNEACYNCP